MTPRLRRTIAASALLAGVGLFALALHRIDVRSFTHAPAQLGIAVLWSLLVSAVWHLLRTVAWWRAFPADSRIPFAQAFRVRLAAEAFSYLTVSGVAGDPLKVVLLSGCMRPAIAARAVALERVAYIFVTATILGLAAVAALANVPLDRTWVHVFTAIAIVAFAAAAVLPFVLLRRRFGTEVLTSRVARLLHGLATDARELARRPRRLALLVALEAAAYLSMAVEVWVIVRAVGISVRFIDVVAIETFTRAASLASAVIPANLGALEASNIAAAAAIHAAGAAAALAIVRRLRGLAWCGAGLLIYPRRGIERPSEVRKTLVIMDEGERKVLESARLGGWLAGERIVRAAARAGYTQLLVWTTHDRERRWRSWSRSCASAIAMVATHDLNEWQQQLSSCSAALTVVAPGFVPSPTLLSAAEPLEPGSDSDGVSEVPCGSEYPRSGVFRAALDTAMMPDRLLARIDRPESARLPSGEDVMGGRASLSMRVTTMEEAERAERDLRASIVKPTDGRVGRFNRRLSIPLSVALIRFVRLSPHAMSVLLTALGVYAGWLFSQGGYENGIIAALLSWVASVLDGCDGELARLQYKASAFGCWLDTIGDYVYYIAIFGGITIHAVHRTRSVGFLWVGGALLVGMLLTFALLIVLRRRITSGRPEQLRARTNRHLDRIGTRWSRIVKELSTCTTRATMPYGIVAFAAVDMLPALLALAALAAQLYWIVLATQVGVLLRSARPQGLTQPT